MILSIMPIGIMTLSIMPIGIMTVSIIVNNCNIQHNGILY